MPYLMFKRFAAVPSFIILAVFTAVISVALERKPISAQTVLSETIASEESSDLEALEALQGVLQEARERGDRTAELEALFNIADFHQDRNQDLDALETYQAVLELAQDLGDSDYELISYLVMSKIYDGIAIDKNSEVLELRRSEEWQHALESAQQGVMAAEQAVQLARQGKARAEAVNDEAFIPDLTLAIPRALGTLATAYQGISNSQQEQAIDLIAEQNYRQAESLEAESIAAAEKAVEVAQESLTLMRNSENFNNIYTLDLLGAVLTVAQSHDMVGLALYRVRSLRLNNEGEFEQQAEALELALAAYETALPFHRESEQLWNRDEIIEAISESEFQLEKEVLLGIINVRLSLSSAYGELGRYQEGIAVAERTIELSRQLPDRESELLALIDLTHHYDDLGEQYLEAEDYEQALAAQEKSLFYAQEQLKVAQSFINSPELSDFESDIYAERGIGIVESALLSISTAYAGIRWVYTEKDDYESALEISLKMLDIDEQIENPVLILSSLQALYVDYDRLSRYQEALEVTQRRLDLARQLEHREEEYSALIAIASLQQDLGQYPEAIANYEEAQSLAIENGNLDEQRGILLNLGVLYATQGDREKASENYEKVIEMTRATRQKLETASVGELESLAPECLLLSPIDPPFDIELPPEFSGVDERADIERLEKNRQRCIGSTWATEQKVLSSQAVGYAEQGRYEEAIELQKRSLDIVRTHSLNRVQEVSALNGIGSTYGDRGDYSIAIEEYLQQALELAVDINHQPSILLLRNNLGATFFEQGNYPAALDQLQQALTVAQETRLLPEEGYILNNIGKTYYNQGEYEKATEFFQKGLSLSQQLGQKTDQAAVLSGLSLVKLDQGQYDQALDDAQQSLALFQETGVKASEASLLVLVGRIQFIQGNYAEAINAKQQALTINQNIGDKDEEAYALQQLGLTYSQLGQYDRALGLNQQALTIAQNIGDRARTASSLDAIANIYAQQQQYRQALDYHDQALTIWRDIESPVGEARSLRDMGFIQEKLGHYDAAEDALQTALKIQQDIGAIGYQGLTENGLALAYAGQGETDKALSLLQRAIARHQQLKDITNEIRATSDMGQILAEQDQVELAITFLKQAVNLTETLRAQLNGLPKDEQEAFAEVVGDRYRLLSDLLLQQDRVLEAQEVLDLLKLQELEDFNLRTGGTEATAQGLELWPAEQAILDGFARHLTDSSDSEFDAFLNRNAIQQQVEQLRRDAKGQNLNPAQLEKLQDNLQQLGNAALLYPLVLDDRLELILVTTSGISRKTVDIDRSQLEQTIQDFRFDITTPTSNPIPNAQRLHQWLIQPLTDDLSQSNTDIILYASDSQLRYIPLAALHDGDQWLTERYTINHITAASLTDFSKGDRRTPTILAGAFSDPGQTYDIDIDDQTISFNGLRYAGVEVKTIEDDIPNTQAFFDKDFSRANIEPQMADHSIVHFATHAHFAPGFPHESFILFGDGDRVSLRDISNWNLPNTDLVVLSACQTAVSGELGNGEEILGFGYQMQQTGARAAIASLWAVNDSGTQTLMNAFYLALQNGYSETEALRLAQTALIQDNLAVIDTGEARSARLDIVDKDTGEIVNPYHAVSHPYYWAPFILIGNGL